MINLCAYIFWIADFIFAYEMTWKINERRKRGNVYFNQIKKVESKDWISRKVKKKSKMNFKLLIFLLVVFFWKISYIGIALEKFFIFSLLFFYFCWPISSFSTVQLITRNLESVVLPSLRAIQFRIWQKKLFAVTKEKKIKLFSAYRCWRGLLCVKYFFGHPWFFMDSLQV